MSSKNPEKSLQRNQFESQLFWHEHGEGNARQAAQASHEDEEDAFFLFWIRRPQSSCAPKNCVVVFIQNFGIRARKYQSSDTLLSSTAPVFTGGNPSAGAHSKYFMVTWKLSRMKGLLASNCYRQRWGRLTLKLCLLTISSFEFNFHSFKLRISLDTELIHISIKKVLFDRQKTLSRNSESTIAFFRFRYKTFLKFCLS